MSTIVTRVGKGSPLTWTEVDSNFTNLNTDKLQSGNTAASLTITSATINGGTITGITDLAVADGGTGLSTLTAGYIPFGAGTSAFGSSANLFWDSTNNRLGIGISSPAAKLNVSDNSSSDAVRITQTGAGNALVVEDSANPDASPFVIDAAGNVIQGYTANITSNAFQANSSNPFSGIRWNAAATGPTITIGKSRSATIGTRGIVSSGDTLGTVGFAGDDGANFIQAASILSAVDGTPGTNDMPGRLTFLTTADGASSPTERMRIDSSGNVGIGTSSPSSKLTVGGNPPTAGAIAAVGSNGGISLALSDNVNSSLYVRNLAGGPLIGTDGANALRFATSGNTATEERMRIDSSGNVGIGTASLPNAGTPNERTFTISGTNFPQLYYIATATAANNTTWRNIARNTAVYQLQITNDAVSTEQTVYEVSRSANSVSYQRWFGGTTEAMRIDSSGHVYIGTTGNPRDFTSGGGCVIKPPANTFEFATTDTNAAFVNYTGSASGSSTFIVFRQQGAGRGSISTDGSTTAYNTTSDYRLKENIAPMTGALDIVAQLKPSTYTWKETGVNSQGFIAHELAEVVPDCVTGEKDAVETYTDEEGNEKTKIKPQGVDTSFLVATLTAAIQEQQTIINDLKARIETLEGK
jgi:hypothetical protein